jgi:cation diffusion facilitator family transporter
MPEDLGYGIFIIAGGGLLNFILGVYSIRVGKKHNSIALVAGGKHLHSDTYSTIGLVIGLLLLWWTRIAWLDSVIALIFGGIIIYTGFKILKETTSNLMDKTDFKIVEEITTILWKNKRENWVEMHNLKLIKYGDVYHIDCDLVVPWYMNIKDAHAEGDNLVKLIHEKYNKLIDFTVHMDACFPDMCHQCSKSDCLHREFPHTDEDVWTVEIVTAKKSVHKRD